MYILALTLICGLLTINASMFKDFDIQKYLNKKPPSDGSFTTTQEIKELNSIPINERFVKEKDDIKSSFLKLAKKKDLNISSEDLDKVIAESAKVILKIKKHHNRPRPKVLAKKNNIKFDDKELDSMKTPSYPSGHSVQGILIAKLIGDKFPKHAKEFLKLGKDISYSRNVAHAHYKSDSKFGEQLGKDMYEHLKPSSPLKCWKGYERVAGTAKGSKGSCKKSSPAKKRMGKFQESDAPDAKGKFKSLSASSLASWMIKARKGNLSKIISSLNQQVVFRRNKDPKYAAKMRKTMDIVRKRLGKDKK